MTSTVPKRLPNGTVWGKQASTSAGVASDPQESGTFPWDQVVYRVMARLTRQPVSDISDHPDRPVEDLMDSLMRVELMAALETRFDTTIPDAEALKIHTVQDVLDTVRRYISDLAAPVVDQPVDTSDYWARMLESEKMSLSAETVSHKKSMLSVICLILIPISTYTKLSTAVRFSCGKIMEMNGL